MRNDIKIDLSVDLAEGMLRACFRNCDSESVRLRYLYEPFDVIIESEEGQRVKYYLSFGFGADVELFSLGPGASRTLDIDMSDFIYPKSGRYTAWINYDTTRETAKYARSGFVKLRVSSNRVSFPVELSEEYEKASELNGTAACDIRSNAELPASSWACARDLVKRLCGFGRRKKGDEK